MRYEHSLFSGTDCRSIAQLKVNTVTNKSLSSNAGFKTVVTVGVINKVPYFRSNGDTVAAVT